MKEIEEKILNELVEIKNILQEIDNRLKVEDTILNIKVNQGSAEDILQKVKKYLSEQL